MTASRRSVAALKAGHQKPAAGHPGELAGNDPERREADGRTKSSQSKIEPRGLAGRSRRERDHPVAEALPADVVVTERTDAAGREKADEQEGPK